MMANNPISSQTSSHAPLDPFSGTTLLHAELNRRATLRPPCATGCRELDEAALISGGFEGGCVVGVSAEEDDVALVIGLQTIAKLLIDGGAGRARKKGRTSPSRAMIITTMGVGSLVGMLREVLRAQGVDGRETETEVLGRVAVSRVFDVNGLWEVLGEVDALGGNQEVGEELRTPEGGQGEEFEKADKGHADEVGEESLLGGAKDDLKPVATSGEGDSPGGGCESTMAATMKAPWMERAGYQDVDEPLSSPLSDPPSSLSETAPWRNTVEMAELDKKEEHTSEAHTNKANSGDEEQLRETPPGQRWEIQDSEAEEGFSSPLAPSNNSPGSSPVKRMEPQSETKASPSVERKTIEGVQYDASSQLVGLFRGQNDSQPTPSPVESAVFAKLDQEDCPSRPARSKNTQDDNIQPNSKVSKPVAVETRPPGPSGKNESIHPDIILITHMSTLLSSLFHQREKATAHQTLQLLASHMRYLTRSMDHGGPLIMILNSTTSSDSNAAAPAQDQDRGGPPRPPPTGGSSTPNKPLDPTLRSIFNPPPLPVSGLAYNYDTPHSRRNKPSFGLIFTQLLDLHLLCTKIPRTRVDAEALYAPTSLGIGKVVKYVWAVEVLLDEIGVWEGRGKVLEGKPRRFREQRWGAVEVRKDGTGVRVVDAFEKTAPAVPKQIIISAGFGGPRV